MSQPAAYVPATTFLQFGSEQINLPGQEIDAELFAIKATTDQVRANLALIQRDDGALENRSVGVDQLSDAVRALLGGAALVTPFLPSNGGTGVANADASTLTLAGPVTLPAIVQGDLWYGSAAGVISSLAKSTSATRYLSNTGTSNAPAWAQIDLATGVTGTLLAAQEPAHTGDVTNSAGSLALTIANSAVTLAKMANMATASLVYRRTAGTGAPEVNTLAQLKTDLALVKGDVGLGNVDNTSDANKPVSTAQAAADAAVLAASQPLDSDLTTIAALTATTDSFMQSKGSAWSARTIAQVKTDLGLTGTNSGDQTITLTGDVTGSGTGSFAATIGATKVTSAMLNSDVFSTAHSWGGIQTLTTPVFTGLPTGTGVATANTVSTLVSRDGSGNFSAGTITAALTGNASTATALANARTIGGTSFNGTANITVATATAGFTVSGGDLAIGANNLTITGSIGSTGSRSTKGWFTDLQVTNAIAGSVTGNAATVTTNANLTGDVTSSGNASTIGATKVTSAMLNSDVFSTAHSWGGIQTLTTPVFTGLPTGTGVATANTVSTLVARDGSGNFSAGAITAGGVTVSANSAALTANTTNATNANFTLQISGTRTWQIQADGTGGGGLTIFNAGVTGGVQLANQSATSWSAFSDEESKEDVETLSVLDTLDDFRAVRFRNKFTGAIEIGIIAQDEIWRRPEYINCGNESPFAPDRLPVTSLADDHPRLMTAIYDRYGAEALQGVKELRDETRARLSRIEKHIGLVA